MNIFVSEKKKFCENHRLSIIYDNFFFPSRKELQVLGHNSSQKNKKAFDHNK